MNRPTTRAATITWNTDVNAPCCPGEIVAEDGRSILVQTDWDYPGVASSFGWSTRNVQRCPECGSSDVAPITDVAPTPDYCGGDNAECQDCGAVFDPCDHSGTDGTGDCEECGVSASEFIATAGEWLRDNNGLTADDPGYFDGEG